MSDLSCMLVKNHKITLTPKLRHVSPILKILKIFWEWVKKNFFLPLILYLHLNSSKYSCFLNNCWFVKNCANLLFWQMKPSNRPQSKIMYLAHLVNIMWQLPSYRRVQVYAHSLYGLKRKPLTASFMTCRHEVNTNPMTRLDIILNAFMYNKILICKNQLVTKI